MTYIRSSTTTIQGIPGSTGSRTEFAMLVTFHSKPEYREELEKLLREDVLEARKEEGNLYMQLYRAKDNPYTCFLFERWKDQGALDAHFEKPYTKAVLELCNKALTAPMAIMFLNDLTPISPVHYQRLPKDAGKATDLVVVFSVKEGEQERFVRQFQDSAQYSRSEPGCVAFHVHAVKDASNTFVLYERWESREALDAHFEQPYTEALFTLFEEVLEQPVEECLNYITWVI
ncbi:putative quinol monooxygenase [Sinomicrobium weinanense]|uniref:Antibiotic biosynthesis monooxygenase n=1 Tax=Sinomicrobium weinanense TaxID=2842200 RepID=A0A926JUD7_9FLAO|nr:antibiotic biosynthesis monooxygenase [Sinomicrobium weinanense]MBC9797554.1 antibiotic biosynthesis monooxygenase [Sinomicrobium weinanense]MBU3123909.1 antibiotic biosynthesis monooxygenase [Sinomicrobium weinanense]